jgi:sugar lactone lactonase YvrE
MTAHTRLGRWQVAVPAGCEIAERPVWDATSKSVVWVDVLDGTLHRSTPSAQGRGEWTDEAVRVGDVLGAAALRRDGGLVAAVDSAFVLLDNLGRPDGDPVAVEMPPGARFNDGACDPAGRFMAGTTSADEQPGSGLLWSIDASRRLRIVLADIAESNGLGWSLDGRVMYYIDSGDTAIRRYRYDGDRGVLGPRLTDLCVIAPGDGVPDGLVIDSGGAVWVALWQGGALRRYAPEGELLEHVDVPVDRPTCPGFAGPALDLLILTTAWEGMRGEERARQTWAGHLLAAPVSVTGRLPHRYAGAPR